MADRGHIGRFESPPWLAASFGSPESLLARSGVGLVVAQRILRHSDPRLTANIYSRVDLGDLQAGIDRLGIPSVAQAAPR